MRSPSKGPYLHVAPLHIHKPKKKGGHGDTNPWRLKSISTINVEHSIFDLYYFLRLKKWESFVIFFWDTKWKYGHVKILGNFLIILRYQVNIFFHYFRILSHYFEILPTKSKYCEGFLVIFRYLVIILWKFLIIIT